MTIRSLVEIVGMTTHEKSTAEKYHSLFEMHICRNSIYYNSQKWNIWHEDLFVMGSSPHTYIYRRSGLGYHRMHSGYLAYQPNVLI